MANVETIEAKVALTESEARKIATTLIQQRQKVTFVNKKVNAVGKALAATDALLETFIGNDAALAEVFDEVAKNQKIVSQTSIELEQKWQHVETSQRDETKNLAGLYSIVEQASHQLHAYNAQLMDAEKHNRDYKAEQCTKFAESIDLLAENINKLDVTDVIANVLQLANLVYCSVNTQNELQMKTTELINNKIDMIMHVVSLAISDIHAYNDALIDTDTKVQTLLAVVKSVDKKVSLLTPKAYDISSDAIIEMYEKLNDENPVLIDSDTTNDVSDEASEVSEVSEVSEGSKTEVIEVSEAIENSALETEEVKTEDAEVVEETKPVHKSLFRKLFG